jgi:predicted enzyme related to lactoylglutathione lyase
VSYPHGDLVLVIDCADLDRAAGFWCAVLGLRPDGPARGTYLHLRPIDGGGVPVLLQRVAERKKGKNRLHLDLRVPDLEAEVARVVAAGATLLTEEPVVEAGSGWHVLADPDGNEFCVVQPGA